MKETNKRPRLELVKALAHRVAALSTQALMEGTSAINEAMECDYRIWEYLSDDTKNILVSGLGYREP